MSYLRWKKVVKGYNDFATKFPHLLENWDFEKNNISPFEIAYGSDKKCWWKCPAGHSYEQSINNHRVSNSCPFCSNKKVLSGFNDISTTHPILAKEWDKELNQCGPTDVSAGSHKKVWWVCSVCQTKWLAPIYNRTAGHGCPECSKTQKGPKKKTNDEFISQLNNINPNINILGNYIGAKEKIKCSCLICGTEWFGTPTNLLRGHGCPECSRKKK